jgi:hypothetical protein
MQALKKVSMVQGGEKSFHESKGWKIIIEPFTSV